MEAETEKENAMRFERAEGGRLFGGSCFCVTRECRPDAAALGMNGNPSQLHITHCASFHNQLAVTFGSACPDPAKAVLPSTRVRGYDA